MSERDFDKWARFYDVTHEKYREDIEFYRKEAKKAKGPVLEVACGTGRIYLELLRNGIDAYGIDISGKLLSVLKKKAKAAGVKPKVYKKDMRNFRLRKKFSLIFVPYNSFLHNLTVEDQLSTLRTLKKHLKKGGRLTISIFLPNPEFIVKNYGKVSRKPLIINRKKHVYECYPCFIDVPNQIVENEMRIKRGNKTIWKMKFRLALIYKREFGHLLRLAGFRKWKVYGGFDYRPLKSAKQQMNWVIRNL